MTQDLDARAALAEQLWNDPETRPLVAAAIKKKFPQADIPEYDARVVVHQGLQKINEELEKDRAERRAERQRRDLEAARQEIVTAGLAETEDIPAIEKLMTEELIGSHRAAAEVYRNRRAVATPRSSAQTWTVDIPGVRGAGGDEFKGLVEDPQAWGRNRASEIFNDFRNGNGSKWM